MEITITVDGAVSGKYATIVKSALIAYLLYLEKDMEVTLSLDKTGAMATMVIFPGTTFDVSLTDNITAHTPPTAKPTLTKGYHLLLFLTQSSNVKASFESDPYPCPYSP